MNRYSHFEFTEGEIIRPQLPFASSEWRLLRRLRIPDRFNEPSGGSVKRALVIDVEATGLSIERDDVVQIALLPFDYEVETGRILSVYKDQAFEQMREPAVPMSEEATLVTGITNEMLAGQSIDSSAVAALVAEVDLVIAHNARFDRGMVERHWQCFSEKPWACTLTSVDWLREGFSAGKLDYLGMQYGWFYDGHRALADCEACLALLAQVLPKSGRPVMSVVREAALSNDYLVRAVDTPYGRRDRLKQRGYRWRPADLPNGKVWWTMTTDPEGEIAWLKTEVYGADVKVPVHEITALNRFSERIWQVEC